VHGQVKPLAVLVEQEVVAGVEVAHSQTGLVVDAGRITLEAPRDCLAEAAADPPNGCKD